MDLNLVILFSALVLLAGVAAVRIATRVGLPSLLLYLLIGLAIGESGLGLQFEDVDLTMVLSTVALAVILAEGGLSTRLDAVRPVLGQALLLATAGVLVSVFTTALIARLALGMDWRTALLIGAIVGSTDAAATFSIMRRMPVLRRLRATVEAESGFNDPPVIVLVTVVASDAWTRSGVLEIAGLVVYQLAIGAVVGLLVAQLGREVLSRSALPASGLYPLATFAILFLAFAVAGLVSASALMAIYVAGISLGNARLPHRQATAGFADGLGWLAQIGLFVLLGLLASPTRLPGALLPAAVIGVGLTFVARPVAVLLCTLPWRMPWRHQVFLSWAGLRGAVPIVLATIPIARDLPSATRIFDVVFVLVVVFILIQAPLLPWFARRTGVAVDGTTELEVESAPLDEVGVSLLQMEVPEGSRLAGVHVVDLRLPRDAAVGMVRRGARVFVPDEHTSLRTGDHLLLAVSDAARPETEARLHAIDRDGRLALWYGAPQRAPRRRQAGVSTQSASTGAPSRSGRRLAMLAETTTRPGSSHARTRIVSPGNTTPANRARNPATRSESPSRSASVTSRSTIP
jgi:cell volume regulation protein A